MPCDARAIPRGRARFHFRTGSVAAFGALAIAAALVTFGRLHALTHADAIVPVLVSLQRWTPFYWDQERFGMLVPLLALPVRDPLWNLLLQRFLMTFGGLAAVLLLARHVLAGREWRLAGCLAVAALLVAWPAPWSFEYLWDQPYGLSLALALAGLAVTEPAAGAGPAAAGLRGPSRLAAGLLLVIAAHWVNAATGVLLLPLAAARAAVDALEGEPRRAVRERLLLEAGLLVAGLLAGHGLLRLYPILSGHPLRLALGTAPLASWPAAWAASFERAWREGGGWPAEVAVMAAGGVVLALALGRGGASGPGGAARSLRGDLLRALALAAAAGAYALFTAVLLWVRENAYHWRYLAPSAVLIQVGAAGLLADPLARRLRAARPALVVALALVPLAALDASGRPSLAAVRADLERQTGRWTADVRAAGCEVVAGDYWTVWPAVFHAAWTRAERSEGAPVWGLTHRANPTAPSWADRPRAEVRICRVRGKEREAERWLRSFHRWPVEVLERRETVDVLRALPEDGGGDGGEGDRR